MNKTNPRKPNQFQRTMIAMEKAGAIRRDGKSTMTELTPKEIRDHLKMACGFDDAGGNEIPDRIEANNDRCDQENAHLLASNQEDAQ